MKEFILGDCMEHLKNYADNFFDLAIVDPPYGIGINTMSYTNGVVWTKNASAKRRDYTTDSKWDVAPTKEYFDELLRVSKKQVVWGGNYFADKLPPSKSFIVWDKRCDDNMVNSFADCEYAWASSGCGVARVFRYLWNGMLQGDMKNKEDRFHPTQKPVALYKWVLSHYAEQGDKILDTHVGSASSLIACEEMGFDYVGYEIDEGFYNLAKQRIEDFNAQVRWQL